ncbi:winged helix-turn-helix transcriptional regulator [Streptomyces sp. Ag109_O5-10]|uniref:winged helix-turn-helix transcriptional regulator n=1 Tax=Streptomyces sp. Ag109_O5-10 TaxID=1855349 RepID=UPI00089A2FE1|nr:winged helix-turn-helix transcriptional regulator [Streptomyces sp. Ag109_O5-10]SEE78944.1 DNA-binding transcriptional regulator, HxlR family [Streptomyces sp. Ag109_O5-10]
MRMHNADETCGVAQAALVLGDWWNVLVLREVARGQVRFDALAAEIGLSRKVLTERLGGLVAQGVLRRALYQRRPVRYEYLLTDAGTALLPVLVAMQDWGDRWALGDGTLTATAEAGGAEHARVHALPGTRLPEGLDLPGTAGAGPGTEGADVPLIPPDASATVLFAYPGTGVEWGPIPGAAGCTLENRLFRDAWPDFHRAGVAVRGTSTQLPHEQLEFARAEQLPYPLVSDAAHQLAAALRLPVFRGAGRLRHKRLILVVDAERTVRHTLFPVTDIPHAVAESLRLAAALRTPVARDDRS